MPIKAITAHLPTLMFNKKFAITFLRNSGHQGRKVTVAIKRPDAGIILRRRSAAAAPRPGSGERCTDLLERTVVDCRQQFCPLRS
jgi:hypothetical protein